jgi:hypothetical protein
MILPIRTHHLCTHELLLSFMNHLFILTKAIFRQFPPEKDCLRVCSWLKSHIDASLCCFPKNYHDRAVDSAAK